MCFISFSLDATEHLIRDISHYYNQLTRARGFNRIKFWSRLIVFNNSIVAFKWFLKAYVTHNLPGRW